MGSAVTLTNTTISNNTAGGLGGGIESRNAVTLTNSTISDNSSGRDGGGISSLRNVILTNSTISDNSSGRDGGGIDSLGNVTLTDSTISDNSSGRGGGGISSASAVTLTNSTVSSNSSSGLGGGGIFSTSAVTLIRSTVSDNTAADDGGGIGQLFNGTVTLTNSLIAGNRAGGNGGGVYGDNITVNNSTIVGNQGGNGGGLYSVINAATLNNSLVLGNDAPANPQIRFTAGLNINNSAYGFATGESTNDSFVGLDMADVFVDPINPAAAPTDAGNYRLVDTSPALDSGDNALAAGILADLDGGARILADVVDMGAYEGVFRLLINPNQDIQIRNGNSTADESITSNGFDVLSYGPFNRGQNVVLEYLVRNPGARTLELGELVLPSFLSVAGDALPSTLASFDSVLLELAVDTSTAGILSGQVSLASNDPDTNENPFTFNLIIRVGDTPANALYVLPGIDLADTTITPNQQNVPVYSAYLITPEGSTNVTINSLTLNTDDIPALRDVQSLTLLIDGGTRGIQDNRDVVLSTIDAPTADGVITFEFNERTLQPNLPFWILVTADF